MHIVAVPVLGIIFNIFLQCIEANLQLDFKVTKVSLKNTKFFKFNTNFFYYSKNFRYPPITNPVSNYLKYEFYFP